MDKYVWQHRYEGAPWEDDVLPQGYEPDEGPFGSWQLAAVAENVRCYQRLLTRIDRALIGVYVRYVPAEDRPEGVPLTEKLVQGRGPYRPDEVYAAAEAWQQETGGRWVLLVVTDGSDVSHQIKGIVDPRHPVPVLAKLLRRAPGVLDVLELE